MLAFWSHGMQGRSLDTNEVSGPRVLTASMSPYLERTIGMVSGSLVFQVTQEITDETRIFRVLGAHRYLQCAFNFRRCPQARLGMVFPSFPALLTLYLFPHQGHHPGKHPN